MNTKLLGRYECINPEKNQYKFWHIILNLTTQKCHATWGRIGHQSPMPVEYDLAKAEKKILEKIKKGYKKVDGYEETIGLQSLHYLKEMCKG